MVHGAWCVVHGAKGMEPEKIALVLDPAASQEDEDREME
jgi:hypothetical protein